jgi:hypothetical protein
LLHAYPTAKDFWRPVPKSMQRITGPASAAEAA